MKPSTFVLKWDGQLFLIIQGYRYGGICLYLFPKGTSLTLPILPWATWTVWSTHSSMAHQFELIGRLEEVFNFFLERLDSFLSSVMLHDDKTNICYLYFKKFTFFCNIENNSLWNRNRLDKYFSSFILNSTYTKYTINI